MENIKFNTSTREDAFYQKLRNRVETYLKTLPNGRFANALFWIKGGIYLCLFWGAYFLILFGNLGPTGIILLYASLGISGLLIAFNLSHDACHDSPSRNIWLNKMLYYLTFNALGTDAYLWQMRHVHSHHLFPNVDDCDADIDNNFIIRLSPNRPLLWHHRWQHIYGPLLYSIYTLHWVFYKDWYYLGVKNLANLKNIKHSSGAVLGFLCAKLFYLFYLLIVPVFLLDIPWQTILVGFLAMHVVLSYFFLFTNIMNHHVEEADFPIRTDDGRLPYSWARHQMETCLDYSPTNKVLNFFFGGFNSHCAHHLFPRVCHVHYVPITRIISETAAEFGIEHKKSKWWKAVKSHLRHLRELGRKSAFVEEFSGP